MENATPSQHNAAKTYISGNHGPLKKWHPAKDKDIIFVETGEDIVTVMRLIDDYIKVIPWAEMSPAMKEEALSIISPASVEYQAAPKHPNLTNSNGQPVRYTATWKKWRTCHMGRCGFLPDVIMSVGFILFLLCCILGFLSASPVLFFVFPIAGALIWFGACVCASFLHSIRAIETYAANIYVQTRSINSKE